MATYLLTQLEEGNAVPWEGICLDFHYEYDPYITVPDSFLNLQVISMSYQIHYFNGGISVIYST